MGSRFSETTDFGSFSHAHGSGFRAEGIPLCSQASRSGSFPGGWPGFSQLPDPPLSLVASQPAAFCTTRKDTSCGRAMNSRISQTTPPLKKPQKAVAFFFFRLPPSAENTGLQSPCPRFSTQNLRTNGGSIFQHCLIISQSRRPRSPQIDAEFAFSTFLLRRESQGCCRRAGCQGTGHPLLPTAPVMEALHHTLSGMVVQPPTPLVTKAPLLTLPATVVVSLTQPDTDQAFTNPL